jgi:hypothetical protein
LEDAGRAARPAYAPSIAPLVDAATVIELLGLEPHPTCGYVAETYRSRERIASGGLQRPFADGRPVGSACISS